jgi:hypothetical protein
MNEAIDLEDDITRVWSVKDDIELLIWRYVDHPTVMTEDEVWNHLAGISSRLDLLCEKLWDTYCKKFELNHYATAEKLAYRKEWLENFNAHLKQAREATEKNLKKKAKKK